eukprot:364089-Chlamydomonas_euryale.AAC.19
MSLRDSQLAAFIIISRRLDAFGPNLVESQAAAFCCKAGSLDPHLGAPRSCTHADLPADATMPAGLPLRRAAQWSPLCCPRRLRLPTAAHSYWAALLLACYLRSLRSRTPVSAARTPCMHAPHTWYACVLVQTCMLV